MNPDRRSPRRDDGPRGLDVHIKRLRHKIEEDPHNPTHILTVRGLGYKFADAPE